MKKLLILSLSILFLMSCGNEKRGGFNFDKLKPKLNLSADTEKSFDAIVQKYKTKREETFSAMKEGGKMDRTAMMQTMGNMIKDQNKELKVLLNNKQFKAYQSFMAPMMNRFTPPGYSKEIVNKITTELSLDDSQTKMLLAVNKAFEKSYIDAHDYYHGNNEAAKEYWNKYDEERKKAIKSILNHEQYATYLNIVSGVSFKGEHGGGDTAKKEHKH